MPWLLAVRRKKLRHLHPLLLLKLLPLLLLLRPLKLLPLLLLLRPLKLLLLPLLLLTLPSLLKLLLQNNHQIIFKKPVSGPVFFRLRFLVHCTAGPLTSQ